MSEVIVEPIEKYGLSRKDRPKQLFSRVGIVGCGTVGQNIALMISQKELEVVFIELSEEKISYAMCRIESELDTMIEHWGMTAGEKRAILSRIHGYIGYENLKGCDLVIESIRSKTRERRVTCRKEVFKNIEKYVSKECIIATNSSTIVITELSSELEHNERCVSLHFLTSIANAKMIEVVRGLYTSDEVFDKVCKFVRMMGKEAITVQESPGLISVRIFVALLNEACEVLLERVGSMEDIDKTMRIGLGLTLGPFETADKIGLDKVMRYMENLYNEFGDKKYIASPIIKRLVRANQLGRITGKGFYKYDEQGRKSPNI
jgi:3-hydroxybutyryl-CoA dehydrogenase